MTDVNDLLKRIETIRLRDAREITPPQRITKDTLLIKMILSSADPLGLTSHESRDFDQAFTVQDVDKGTVEYVNVFKLFHLTMSKFHRISSIEKVSNPFLLVQFLLKQSYKKSASSVTLTSNFHGTKASNVDSICKENFDWRKVGCNGMRGNKFGNGISFSPRAVYASKFPRNHSARPRVMFLVKVLKGGSYYGCSSVMVPKEPYDTTKSPCGNVIVKYDDNEFYPDYIIYYD